MHEHPGLASLVRSLSAKRLREIVLELARTEKNVRRRLLCEQSQEAGDDPLQLVARFQNLLDKLLNIPETASFKSWNKASNWLDRVEEELLPVAPQAALGMLEQLIAADAVLFSDTNSDSESSLFVENVCSLWLCAAARCDGDQQKWVKRVCDLYYADDYCARDVLLSQAHLLFDDQGLHALAERLRSNLSQDKHRMESALKLVACAMRDQKADADECA
jgi:hypothetical protein